MSQQRGKGPVTTTPPEGIRAVRDIWSGKIEIGDLQEHLLIRNVELSASGNLSQITAEIASKPEFKIPTSCRGMTMS